MQKMVISGVVFFSQVLYYKYKITSVFSKCILIFAWQWGGKFVSSKPKRISTVLFLKRMILYSMHPVLQVCIEESRRRTKQTIYWFVARYTKPIIFLYDIGLGL